MIYQTYMLTALTNLQETAEPKNEKQEERKKENGNTPRFALSFKCCAYINSQIFDLKRYQYQ